MKAQQMESLTQTIIKLDKPRSVALEIVGAWNEEQSKLRRTGKKLYESEIFFEDLDESQKRYLSACLLKHSENPENDLVEIEERASARDFINNLVDALSHQKERLEKICGMAVIANKLYDCTVDYYEDEIRDLIEQAKEDHKNYYEEDYIGAYKQLSNMEY